MRLPALLEGPVDRTILRMMLPLVIGMLSLFLFNFVDAYFIGLLGTTELASVSFTFPASFFVTTFCIGLATGTTNVVAKSLGEGNEERAKELSTGSQWLALSCVGICGYLGFLVIDPLFHLLGASPQMMPHIHDYMEWWYLGVPLLAIASMANATMRAMGDTVMPCCVLLSSSLINCVLDPVLMFGWGVPAYGVKGAAIATVVSWVWAALLGLYLLTFRYKMFTWKWLSMDLIRSTWGTVLYIGIPAVIFNVLLPVSSAAVTNLVSQFGEPALAAFGVGARLESLMMVTVMGLSSSLAPFVAQNYGAGRWDRCQAAWRFCLRFAIFWQFAELVVLLPMTEPFARVFTQDADVAYHIQLICWIVTPSYFFTAFIFVNCSAFNGIQRPFNNLTINVVRLLVLYLPLSYLGAHFLGVVGVFIGASVANVIAGSMAFIWGRRVFQETPKPVMEKINAI